MSTLDLNPTPIDPTPVHPRKPLSAGGWLVVSAALVSSALVVGFSYAMCATWATEPAPRSETLRNAFLLGLVPGLLSAAAIQVVVGARGYSAPWLGLVTAPLCVALVMALTWGAAELGVAQYDRTHPVPTPSSTGLLAQVHSGSSSAGSLTLSGCTVGAKCGRLERIDDNRERCVYELTLVSVDEIAKTLTFSSGPGNSFGCGYSPWSKTSIVVTVLGPDHVQVAPRSGVASPLDLELNVG